jgi:hypothetical protein
MIQYIQPPAGAYMRYRRPVAFVLVVGLCGCTGPMRKGAIIEKYTRAEYVSVGFGPGITLPTRAWDHAAMWRLVLHDESPRRAAVKVFAK